MYSDASIPVSNQAYTVSQLNGVVRQLLADEFTDIRVSGEISNLSAPSSGHLYFSLKDNLAQIRCAMFRTRIQRADIKLANGMQVIVRGQVSLYEPRGDYQLIVSSIAEEGAGVLQRNFELLKQKLAAEGLFANAHKKPIPSIPHCIGIVTSSSGAALRDILSVLKRRFPASSVIIYPTSVQGENAKYEIVQALNTANQLSVCEVIILSRGGGSLEDLWAFNEEIVARAIFASHIPVISGVGHEIDFSIADFVADLRAATPSAAAEHAVPEQREWLQKLQQTEALLSQRMRSKLQYTQQQCSWLEKCLQQQHPQQQLLRHAQTLDQLELRLCNAMQIKMQRKQSNVSKQQARLWQHNPSGKMQHYRQQQAYLYRRLQQAILQILQRKQQHLLVNSQTLHALSPLATLERGYAIVQDPTATNVITNSQQVQKGELIHTRFAQGKIISLVKEIYP